MRNTVSDNLQEHCLQTAMIAHALALIDKKLFEGTLDPDKAAVFAMYHDAAEIITGDMPTPVKYFNENMRDTYRVIEEQANDKLLSMLPSELKEDYSSIVKYEEENEEYKNIVKAADKISAYIKCLEEERCGNNDFKAARKTLLQAIKKLDMKCVGYFMDNFIGGFEKPIDELN